MNTLTKKTQFEFKTQGSRFISILFPAVEVTVFEEKLKQLRSEFYGASHHCSAYRLLKDPVIEHSSDDGEPSGTAGLPILNELRTAEIVNAACIVIRYFGGTKLGKSGLIEAYGKSCRSAISKAELKKIMTVQRFNIGIPYDQQNVFDKILEHAQGEIESSDYGVLVRHQVAVPIKSADAFENAVAEKDYLGVEIIKTQKGLLIGN